MQSKRQKPAAGAGRRPKAKRRAKKARSPADPNERLKPISLHGVEFDDVLRKLIRRPPDS